MKKRFSAIKKLIVLAMVAPLIVLFAAETEAETAEAEER